MEEVPKYPRKWLMCDLPFHGCAINFFINLKWGRLHLIISKGRALLVMSVYDQGQLGHVHHYYRAIASLQTCDI